MNRILLEPHEVDSAGRADLADERARHILTVLKAVAGASVRIGLVNGPKGVGHVEAAGAGTVRLRCDWAALLPLESPVDLLLAVPRPKVLKRLWAPLASLGVRRVILTSAARVERSYFATHWLEPEAYRPLLIEGLQQAGETRLPEVHVCRRFRPLVEDQLDEFFPTGLRLVADPAGRERISRLQLPAAARVVLAVGPEGGWTPFELDLLCAHGFRCVGMGPRVLRSDVACIALLALLHEQLDLAQASQAPGPP